MKKQKRNKAKNGSRKEFNLKERSRKPLDIVDRVPQGAARKWIFTVWRPTRSRRLL